jgi:hypothetical protein
MYVFQPTHFAFSLEFFNRKWCWYIIGTDGAMWDIVYCPLFHFRSFAGKFLQIIFWIFIVAFGATYMATFVADRIVDRISKDGDSVGIKSVEELAGQEEIKYGVLRAGSTYDYFRVKLYEIPIYRRYMYVMDLYRQW